jgi:ribosomal protein L20A (L18A)
MELCIFQVDIENMFKEMQKDKCKEALESAVSEIGQKLRKEEYFEDGGETCFHYDYDKAEKAYKECTNLGPEVIFLYNMLTSLVIHH